MQVGENWLLFIWPVLYIFRDVLTNDFVDALAYVLAFRLIDFTETLLTLIKPFLEEGWDLGNFPISLLRSEVEALLDRCTLISVGWYSIKVSVIGFYFTYFKVIFLHAFFFIFRWQLLACRLAALIIHIFNISWLIKDLALSLWWIIKGRVGIDTFELGWGRSRRQLPIRTIQLYTASWNDNRLSLFD